MFAQKSFYFMAGMPRAGSTMLSSILNQNPRIYSGPSSPVVPTMLALESSLSTDELFLAYPKPEIGTRMIASILYQFYSDVNKPVVIDKNRSWLFRLHYIQNYFGIQPKVLVPVRSYDEILTSFITMNRRNMYNGTQTRLSFIDEMLVKSGTPLTDENRCRALIGPGILGQSIDSLKEALLKGYENCIHLIEYDDLINEPQNVMNGIYEFLDEEPFKHDFESLENPHRENDMQIYGLADMHEVRKEVKKVSPKPEDVLPQVILEAVKGQEFWRSNNTDGLNTSNTVSGIFDGPQINIIGT